eukprot:TRINITY_DN3288_c1_g1_i2.p1 TRINITY_DN3288_c1_g1~~TRINITY_DN3288_c1_g1_i2.p1  ORF type:complete len:670 (+),score=84.35 TRINITY_DN3288_c1_g1_i2:65-2074(+)
MHHPLARMSSQEYIKRPKSAQGIHKCPSPSSIYSIDVDFHSPKPTDLSPLVDFNFSLDQVVRSSSVSSSILRPRRNTGLGISSSQTLNGYTNKKPHLQSAFRTRSMSTSQNVFNRLQEREQVGPRISCPNPANLKLRPFNSYISVPFVPLSKASVSLSDNDISLLWTRNKSQGNTNISEVYSLKIKRWFTSRAERLNATMAPKSNLFSNPSVNFAEFSGQMNNYYTRSADKCRGCEGDFFQQEPCLLHDNRLWHYGCLRCDQCDHETVPNTPYLCPIDTDVKLAEVKPVLTCTQSLGRKRKYSVSPEYWKKAAKVICTKCVPTCNVCILSVLNDHVMALGKHWHRDCFRCSVCGDPLGDNFKVYGKKDDVCCSRCIQPLFGQSLTNPNLLRSALSIESEEDVPFDENRNKNNFKICRENSLLFSSMTEMASAFAYALSEHSEKNEEIFLPETHRNYSENLNAFLTHNSLDRKHLKEKKRQKSAMMNLTSSFKSEKTVACPIPAPKVSTSLSSYKTIINSHEGRSLLLDYCMEKYEIEKIYFISDVEGLKDFDTEELDWLVLVRKLYNLYIAPEGQPELLINLPKDIVDEIKEKIKAKNCPIGIFDRAHEFVLSSIEKNIVPSFLKSSHGSQYLKALVSFDNVSRQVIRLVRMCIFSKYAYLHLYLFVGR